MTTQPLLRLHRPRRLLAGMMVLGMASLSAPLALAETPADTLVIANSIDDLKTFDPGESFEWSGQDGINNMYQKLIGIDPETKELVPGVAKDWSVADDGVTYTFTIDTGLKFASGNPVRPEDVVWSLRRAVKLDKTPSFILTQFGFTPDNVDETITAPGDDTVQIVTDKPYAPSFFYNALTAEIGSIVDEKTVMEHAEGEDMGNAWLATHSAGSGPYTLRGWKPNESVLLEANENWPGDLAMKRVFVRHVPEPATQRLLLEKGDVDVARNLTPEDISAIEGNDALKVVTEQRGRIFYLAANQLVEPLANVKVLQAIKYLIDYKGMADTILKGQVAVHQTLLPAGFLGAIDDTPYELNVDKAKELLAEAGYPDGFEVELLVRNEKIRTDMAQAIQATLGQAGIKANIRTATGSEVLSAFRGRKTELTLESWGPDYPDPNTNASVFAANPDNSEEAQLTGNLSWRIAYPAEETTKMVEDAVVEKDTEKRKEMYAEIQRTNQELSPFTYIFQLQEQDGAAKGVDGFGMGGAVSSAFYWPVTKSAE
ncbi:ABC transporter substrate-binding protein [Consotaella aegiceratis]|uniref:ABC transporter substrate-binding protein n=1 Tax=Consotaella aegiceratis TaxID=3097961 RepID=UPI002F417580